MTQKIYSSQHLFVIRCILFFGALIIFISLTGCGLFRRPIIPFEHLDPDDVESYFWEDDLNFQMLEDAIQQSLRYYRRVSDSKSFKFGTLSYSANEMETSLELFIQCIKNAQNSDHPYSTLMKHIAERFHVFESRNPEGKAFFTGYYEPILEGSLTLTDNYTIPLYQRPNDIAKVHVGDFIKKYKNVWITGRVKGKKFVPYDTRDQIVYRNSLAGRAEPIVYVKNHIELFFLQIQGSGIIQLQDGELLRVNYADQNGKEYRAIGALLRDEIPKEEMSLQSLKKYLYDHEDDVRKILNYNQSYTFFRKVEEGPLGNIQVPLTPKRSIAMDHRLLPKGCLAYIESSPGMDKENTWQSQETFRRFVVIQDTGGAINGHGRADIFWGNGTDAETIAGNMKQYGRIFLIVAKKEQLNTPQNTMLFNHQFHATN